MTLRSLVCSIGVTGALVLATVTMTAGAAIERRSGTIPACDELLTVRQALVAMGETVAGNVDREVVRSTRMCSYNGGSKALGHGMGVAWGPYGDYRKGPFLGAKKYMCPVSKAACRNLEKAVRLRSNLNSFAFWAEALDQVGTAKRLPSSAFERNPAFFWIPSEALAPLDQAAWVFVYDVKSAHLLQISCTDTAEMTPDTPCAIAAAKQAYKNITS